MKMKLEIQFEDLNLNVQKCRKEIGWLLIGPLN
jgi:hypothetical protein